MPYIQTGTFTTYQQLVLDFADFAVANGWTVDFLGDYNGNKRFHFHKGAGQHFELYGGPYALACTGYAAGSAPTAQPGVCNLGSYNAMNFTAGNPVMFISTAGGLYLGRFQGFWDFTVFFAIQDKIGTWSGGHGFQAPFYQGSYVFNGTGSLGYTYGNLQMYINGVWSAYNVLAGGVGGTFSSASPEGDLTSAQPSDFNISIFPIPVLAYQILATDTTKYVPLGYVPGLYRGIVRGVYISGETFMVGSDTFISFPINNSSPLDYIFKLGA